MTDLITELYHSSEVRECLCRHFSGDIREDVKHDLFELLINLKPGTLEEKQSRGKLKHYVAAIIANLKRQRYGKVAKMIGQYQSFESLPESIEQKDEEYNDALDRAEKCTENLHWYYAGVLKLYARLGTVRAVSRATQIPYESVKYAITEARKQIKAVW